MAGGLHHHMVSPLDVAWTLLKARGAGRRREDFREAVDAHHAQYELPPFGGGQYEQPSHDERQRAEERLGAFLKPINRKIKHAKDKMPLEYETQRRPNREYETYPATYSNLLGGNRLRDLPDARDPAYQPPPTEEEKREQEAMRRQKESEEGIRRNNGRDFVSELFG
jgi:hypothetical protein